MVLRRHWSRVLLVQQQHPARASAAGPVRWLAETQWRHRTTDVRRTIRPHHVGRWLRTDAVWNGKQPAVDNAAACGRWCITHSVVHCLMTSLSANVAMTKRRMLTTEAEIAGLPIPWATGKQFLFQLRLRRIRRSDRDVCTKWVVDTSMTVANVCFYWRCHVYVFVFAFLKFYSFLPVILFFCLFFLIKWRFNFKKSSKCFLVNSKISSSS